jgi:hypothetical protein
MGEKALGENKPGGVKLPPYIKTLASCFVKPHKAQFNSIQPFKKQNLVELLVILISFNLMF